MNIICSCFLATSLYAFSKCILKKSKHFKKNIPMPAASSSSLEKGVPKLPILSLVKMHHS